MSLSRVTKNTADCFSIQTTRPAGASASSSDSRDGRANAAAATDQPSSFQAALADVHRNREGQNSIRENQPRKPAKAKPKDKSSAEAGSSSTSDENPAATESPPPDAESAPPPSEDAKAVTTPPDTTPSDTAPPDFTPPVPAQPEVITAAAMVSVTPATPPAPPPASESDGKQASASDLRDSEIVARPQRLTDQPKAAESANPLASEAKSTASETKSSASEAKSSATEGETPDAQFAARDTALDTAAQPAAHEKRPKPPVKAAASATPSAPQTGSSQTGGVAASAAASTPPNDAETKAVAIPATLNPQAANDTKSLSGDALTSLGTSMHLGIRNHSEAAEVAPAAQNSPSTSAPDPVDQVVMALKGKFDARTGKAEITLDPPNLGPVKVSVTLDGGVLTAEFRSDSDLVRNLLKGNLEKLKSVLQGQGVVVDRLAVAAPPASDSPAAPQSGQQHSFGSSTHDGRSAGQYQRDSRPGQRSQDANAFDRLFRQAQDPPLDLVA